MNSPQKLMLVEQDIQTARTLRDALKTGFSEVQVAFDGATAARELAIRPADFIILDKDTVPRIDYADVFRELRPKGSTPILVLSGSRDVPEKIRALDAGADDFLEKPPDTRELVSRILAIWRRTLMSPPSSARRSLPKCVEYPQLTISLSNYTVTCDGEAIEMPPKELELLYFLASSPNQVFTREQLLNHIWGYDYIGDARTIDVHIKRIREKIKDHETWSLDTVWGVGYKFRAAAEVL